MVVEHNSGMPMGNNLRKWYNLKDIFKIIEESRKKKQSIIILYTLVDLVFNRKKYENMSWVMEYH